jgi:hypothetical protein
LTKSEAADANRSTSRPFMRKAAAQDEEFERHPLYPGFVPG